MLVLTRKPGEEIIIGGDIRVRVVSVSGNRVRLAFEAPHSTGIHRAEICWEDRAVQPELADPELVPVCG